MVPLNLTCLHWLQHCFFKHLVHVYTDAKKTVHFIVLCNVFVTIRMKTIFGVNIKVIMFSFSSFIQT